MGGPLEGIQVSNTGVSSGEENWIKATVESLGGQFNENLDEKTTCLIAKKVGSEKYRAACTHFKIPVVSMQWLKECRKNNKLMKYSYYGVEFLGLTVCCTQLSLEDRYELERKLEEHGAKYRSDLKEDECTHLIAIEAEGDKYTAAKAWGNVNIVSTEWVDECIRRGRCVPEQPYLVLPRVNGRSRAGATSSRDNMESKAVAIQLNAGFGEQEQSVRGGDVDGAASHHPPGLDWDKLPSVERVGAEQSHVLRDDVFFISGFNPEQTDYLIQMILAGGGKRHFVLTMSVTKVFLGPEANERLILDVFKHPCGAKCVLVEWLVKTLVPDFDMSNDEIDEPGVEMTSQLNEDRNSLDRFEHEMAATDAAGINSTSTMSSRSQRRKSLVSASVNASSAGLKRIASEVMKDRDSSYTSIRRRHSSSKNLTKESQFIDWSHE